MYNTFLSTLLVSMTLHSTAQAAYKLVDDYTGDSFFTGFNFFTGADPTNGHVQFQSLSQANESGLAGFASGQNFNRAVYMGVDTTEQAPNGRRSIRVESTKSYQHALVLADIAHMPGGVCGTWPAFWMVGDDWPNDGEIDIAEGVNDQDSNLMTLHTNAGPRLHTDTKATPFTGELITSDCDVNAPDQSKNAGCSVDAKSGLTFGKNFNANGGGVFATEWTSDAIKIWFFPRAQATALFSSNTTTNTTFPSLASLSPDTSTFGTPSFLYTNSTTNINMDTHFRNLRLIFDTTFCGDWAGATWSSSSCASLAPTCEDYVSNNPAAFVDAFWAVQGLSVFQDDGLGGDGGAQPGGWKPWRGPPGGENGQGPPTSTGGRNETARGRMGKRRRRGAVLPKD